MRHAPRRKPDIAGVKAIAPRLRLWAPEIVAMVAAPGGVKFRPDVSEEIYAAKLCVFLHAIHRCDARGRGFARRHWRDAGPDFRYGFKPGQIRAFTRVVKIRSLTELRTLLDDIEPAIARVVRPAKKATTRTSSPSRPARTDASPPSRASRPKAPKRHDVREQDRGPLVRMPVFEPHEMPPASGAAVPCASETRAPAPSERRRLYSGTIVVQRPGMIYRFSIPYWASRRRVRPPEEPLQDHP